MTGMKKELNGLELVGFIQERQAGAVRNLKQEYKIAPKLAIIRTNPDPVVDSYMRIKQSYGEDIGVIVEVHNTAQSEVISILNKLNNDENTHGIIVQIPLPDPKQTNEILNTVSIKKDVDGLAESSLFDPATPVAINWLLAGYNIQLDGANLLIIGQGRLVGKPLKKMWESSGLEVTTADKSTENLRELTLNADVIVTATGAAGIVTPDMISEDAVIVDAGVATDKNGLIGDVAPEVREMPNIKMTPDKGGVGPLTVAALFENVLIAARNSTRE